MKDLKGQKILNNKKLNFEQAGLFRVLKQSAPPRKSLFVVCCGISLLYQTGLIFNEEFSQIFASNLKHKKEQKQSILSEESYTNKITNVVGLVKLGRLLTPTSLTVIMIILAVLISSLTSYLLYPHFFQKRVDRAPVINKRYRLKSNLFLTMIASILINYDVPFFLFNYLVSNFPVCRKIPYQAEVMAGLEGEGISTKSWTVSASTFDIVAPKPPDMIQVAYINDKVSCGSVNHLILISMAAIILACNIRIKLFVLTFKSLTPNPKFFVCKWGHGDMIYQVFLSLMPILKIIIIIYLKDRYQMIQIIFYICLAVFIMSFLLNVATRPFYNNFVQNIVNLKSCYILILIATSILARETNFRVFRSEASAYIAITLTMTILYKLTANTTYRSTNRACVETKDYKKFNPFNLLNLYFLTSTYIQKDVENKRGMVRGGLSSQIKEVEFSMSYLINQHRSRCRRTMCFCRSSKVDRNLLYLLPLSGASRRFLMMTQEVFENYIRNSKKVNPQVFYAYLDLLINYTGRATYAWKLIEKRMSDMRANCKKQNFDYPLEAKMFLLDIREAGLRNLDSAKLPMAVFDMDETSEVELKHRFDTKCRVYDHVLFLDEIEGIKDKVRKCVDLKDGFLEGLRAQRPLEQLYRTSYAFYMATKEVDAHFHALDEVVNKKYAPLILIYGNYKLSVCQNRKLGYKLLNDYWKKFHMTNLNRIFSGQKLYNFELAVVEVSAEKDDYHTITYATSNIFKWLGFKVKDALGANLSVILPPGLRDIHPKIIYPRNTYGKFFFKKHVVSLVCMNANGFFVPIDVAVRLGASLHHGLRYLGIIEFDLRQDNKCVMMLQPDNKIIGMTENASKWFLMGSYIHEYNEMFSDISAALNLVAEERLKGLKEGVEFYQDVLESKEKTDAWTIWMNWTKSQTFSIVDKRGKEVRVSGRFEDYMINHMNAYARFFIIDEVDRRVYDWITMNEKDLLPEKRVLMETIMKYRVNKVLKQYKFRERKSIWQLDKPSTESEMPLSSFVESFKKYDEFSKNDESEIDKERKQLTNRDVHGETRVRKLQAVDRLLRTDEIGEVGYHVGGRNEDEDEYEEEQADRIEVISPSLGDQNAIDLLGEELNQGGPTGSQIFSASMLRSQSFLQVNHEPKFEKDFMLNSTNREKGKINHKIKMHKKYSSKEKDLKYNDSAKFRSSTKDFYTKSSSQLQNPARKTLRTPTTVSAGLTKMRTLNSMAKDRESQKSIERSRSPSKVNNQSKRSDSGFQLQDKIKIQVGKIFTKLHRKELDYDSGSVGSISNGRRVKFSEIEKILMKFISQKRLHKNTVLGTIFFLLVILMNCLSIYIRNPYLVATKVELTDKVITADYFSWEISAQVEPQFYLDILRMLRFGWIQNDDFLEFRNKTVYEYSQAEMDKIGGYVLEPDNLIDQKLRNLSFHNLFDLSKWIQMEPEIPFYNLIFKPEAGKDENTGKAKIEKIEWFYQPTPRRAALKILQVLSDEIRNRNYLNGSEIIEYDPFSEESRDKDYLEEYYRRLLTSQLNEEYYFRSYDFFDYMKAVAAHLHEVLISSCFASVIGTLVLFVGVLVHQVCEIKRMKRLNEKLFEVKEEDLELAHEKHKVRKEIILSVLQEEQIYEEQCKYFDNETNNQTLETLQKSFTTEMNSTRKPLKGLKKGQKRSKKKRITNAFRGNQSSLGNSSRRNKRKFNIKVNTKGLNFGCLALTLRLVLLLSIFLVIQLVYFFAWRGGLVRTQNLVEVFVLGIDAWNSFASLHATWLTTLVYNNSVGYWGSEGGERRRSLDAYRFFREHIEINVLENYTRALQYDLGNFTKTFRSGMSAGNSCKLIFDYQPELHQRCTFYYNGLFNTNLLSSMRGMLTILDSYIQTWAEENKDYNTFKQVFRDKKFIAILADIDAILYTFYYWSSYQSSDLLKSQLEANTAGLAFSNYFAFPLFGVAALALWIYFVKKIDIVMIRFYSMLLILPFDIVEKNTVMIHHLQKVRKGERTLY